LAAKQGYSAAQYNLGIMYLNGKGVPRNPQLAKDYFMKAADSRHRAACYELGMMYEEGRYVGRDLEEAYICYTLAAQGRHKEASQKRAQLSKMLTADQLRNADTRLYKKRFWRY
jgi:TPR repeat protein